MEEQRTKNGGAKNREWRIREQIMKGQITRNRGAEIRECRSKEREWNSREQQLEEQRTKNGGADV